MKCSRHEIHPMYPADFASQLNVLTLAEMKKTIHDILDFRDEDYLDVIWYFACVSMLKG